LWLCFSGEWLIEEENKKVKGHLEIPEFSFGELEDLEVKTRFCIEFLSIGIEVYNLIHPMEITILEGKKKDTLLYMLNQEMPSLGCILIDFILFSAASIIVVHNISFLCVFLSGKCKVER